MPWVPKTDFEEEVVNLQPDHDFIYGTLSESQYTYPRPQAHVEYAFSKKMENKKQQENDETNQVNGKLKAIKEIQRMTSSIPLGDQPTEDDWDNNGRIEQETVGMLRYHGIPLSIEQPLTEEVTIATFPVGNDIKVIRNGRRKMAYFFDDKVFQLKEKSTDISQVVEDYKANDDSLISNHRDNETLSDTSSNTTTLSMSSYNYSTCGNDSDLANSFNSAMADKEMIPLDPQLIVQRLQQYEKLLEDTASLNLTGSGNTSLATNSSDSYKTPQGEQTNWRPVADDYDPETVVNNSNENWPDLLKTNNRNKNKKCNLNTNSNSLHNKPQSEAEKSISSCTDSAASSSSCESKVTNFLESFIDPIYLNKPTESSKSRILANKPKTYASITKNLEKPNASEKINPTEFPTFYTPRKMYALKRQTK